MNRLSILFRPRFLSFRNSSGKRSLFQALIFLGFGSLVIFAIWYGCLQLFVKLDSLNNREQYSAVLSLAAQWVPVGTLIKERFLSMVLMAIFFMLLFSNTISSISYLFLSRDTELLLAAPIKHRTIFKMRCIESGISSAWMSLFFFAPVLAAYFQNYHTPAHLIIPVFLSIFPFLVIPACIGILFSLFVSYFFPVEQTKKAFNFLFVLFLTLLITLIRMLQPERLFAISDYSQIQSFVENLKVPFFEYIPPTWLSSVISSLLSLQYKNAIFPGLLLFSCAFFCLFLVYLAAPVFYPCWVKSVECSTDSVIKESRISLAAKLSFFHPTTRALVFKDLLFFFRNPELWSQVFLIMAMVALYLYNIHLLHLDKIELYSHSIARFISFMNVAFVGFISTSISMRFLYPAISLEGPALWLLQSSPYPMKNLIFYKFLFFVPVITIIGNLMTLLANWILNIPWWLYLINAANITIICVVNCLLAVSLGAIFPNYKAENVNKIFMSYGGTLYMILSLGYMFLLLFCEAVPAVLLGRYYIKHQPLTPLGMGASILCILAAFIITLVLLIYPYKKAKFSLTGIRKGAS
jgi:ABC-2 type transport system permease protein